MNQYHSTAHLGFLTGGPLDGLLAQLAATRTPSFPTGPMPMPDGESDREPVEDALDADFETANIP